jgi:hypothetical protein
MLTLKEEEAIRQACEATKGHGYEVAFEEHKAKELGYTWPRG